MSIQTNSPSTNLGTSVSADGIAQLLGFADAAAMVAASVQYCVATGGTTNYVATPALALTPVNGTRIAVRFPSNCAANATLNVSGSGAKGMRICTVAGTRLTEASDLLSDTTYIFTYTEDGGGFWVATGGAHLKAADIPSTLNATTFAGDILPIDSAIIKKSSNDGVQILAGGVGAAQSSGAISYFFGNFHGSNAGDALHYTGSASGAAHSFFDKNGAEELKIDENGVNANYITTLSGTTVTVTANSNGGSLTLRSSNVENEASQSKLHSAYHATYPGAHQQFAPLSTRAASTAIALCPVATGDTAKVEISETTIADCLTFVDAAGTVTLYDKLGGTVSASIVNSSSPAAGEYGVYISAGVLYFKGGSSYAGKMGSFSKVWKA